MRASSFIPRPRSGTVRSECSAPPAGTLGIDTTTNLSLSMPHLCVSTELSVSCDKIIVAPPHPSVPTSGFPVILELFGDLIPCTLLTQRRRYFEGRGDSCRLWPPS